MTDKARSREIERLRSERDRYKALYEGCRNGHADELARASIEIEHLRQERDDATRWSTVWGQSARVWRNVALFMEAKRQQEA